MNIKNISLFFVGAISGYLTGFVILLSIATLSNPLSIKSITSTSIPKMGATLIASESPQIIRYTSTPRPTYTPRPTNTPEIGTVRNPIPLGQTAYFHNGVSEIEISILSLVRGNDAWMEIYSANQFNESAPDGMEYVIAEIQVNHTGNDSEIVEVNSAYWKTVSNKRYFGLFSGSSFVCCLSPDLDLSLGSGGEGIGLLALPVFIDDQNPMLVFDDKFYFLLR